MKRVRKCGRKGTGRDQAGKGNQLRDTTEEINADDE